jgi:hypothetical protein
MARIIVVHSTFGCESGCCGHVVKVDGTKVGGFSHSHPSATSDEAISEYVRNLVTEACGADHVADIDFDHCLVVDD